MLEQLGPNLFLFRDTCNVYIIRNDDTAVFIDFGSGDVLNELAALGIARVSDVLMTHHHRDQGQGLPRAAEIGAHIWVPDSEQELFAAADDHWQARAIYNNYNVRQDRFSLLTSIEIAGTLNDYETQVFGAQSITIIPTPGHTIGSVSLFTMVDGQMVAFTGDLIAAPGKVWSLAAMQWTYNGGEGISFSILSLLDVMERNPALLLPSHGEPMTDPGAAIQPLVERLNDLQAVRNQNTHLMAFREHPYIVITPHLLRNITSVSNSYVLLSDSGKALFIDFGYEFATWPPPAGDDRASRRPWLYTLPMLKRDFGVTKIDVVIPTHHHDDHVAGLNLLRRVEGTQIWSPENFVDILERPETYNLPCLWYDPIPVDRALPMETPFQWEEYSFTLYPLPGHTHYAAAISFEADGLRVLATGDQYQDNTGTQFNYVYENGFQISDYRHSAELYARLDPELIISGHWEPLQVKPGYFETLLERGETLERLHQELLLLNTFDLGGTDFVARIEPYQSKIVNGNPVSLEAVVRNPLPTTEAIRVSIILPVGWHADPPEVNVIVGAHEEARLAFKVNTSNRNVMRRVRVAADVTIGHHHFGQHAEALVTVK